MAAQTNTSQAAATTPNLPPAVGNPSFGTPNQATGAIRQVKRDQSEGKKLSYAATTAPGAGTLTFNKTTGAFAFTPTYAQRVLASLPGSATTSFTVTVSDGVMANNQLATVNVPIAAVQLSSLGSVSTGDGTTGVAVTNDRAYVTNYAAGTVTVIDTITGTTVGDPITVGGTSPASVVVTPNGTGVYVGQLRVGHGVGHRHRHRHRADPHPGRQHPVGIAITPNGKTLYVTNAGDGTVSKISTSTNKVTGTVKRCRHLSLG